MSRLLEPQPVAAAASDPARIGRLSSRLRDTARLADPSENPVVVDIPMEYDARSERRMLWIDGVGGYLVCLANDVTVGRAAPASDTRGPDIGLQADLASRHATISRTEGRYVLKAHGPTTRNDKPVEESAVLEPGDVIQLGDATRLRFERPHALSATARLVIVSGHRTAPMADGVLLMGESCVLGPQPHSHVRCPKWSQEVLLFKGKAQLQCRSGSPVSITRPGEPSEDTTGPAAIPPGARIEAEDLCLSVEEV
ncbi:MAG: FHA domain-containing protein [Planctomycetota bacterium]